MVWLLIKATSISGSFIGRISSPCFCTLAVRKRLRLPPPALFFGERPLLAQSHSSKRWRL